MDKIKELLTRGVEKIYPGRDLLEKELRDGKKLRLYQGFDPSGIQLHIGHLVGLVKLRQFQLLGHEVIFLIGDGTGQAGDPSGKTRTREKFLNKDELRGNARDYVLQASKIIDFEGDNKAVIKYNSDWLNKLKLVELLDIAGHFTLQQLEERDLYRERIKANREINFREFLYPLLQGYDSVAMDVDLEIGGSDQTFNMLCGRQLVRQYLNKEKYVLTMPLLTDARGNKIGKTEGNVIALTSGGNELYGMIMNLPDDVIVNALTYITFMPLEEISEIGKNLEKGHNPMEYKKKLAWELVKILNDKKTADKAQEYFEDVFQKKSKNAGLTEKKLKAASFRLPELLLELSMAKSSGEAKRLINQNAVEINGKKVSGVSEEIKTTDGMVIKVGKHRIVRLKV